jgi:hypothetical protein
MKPEGHDFVCDECGEAFVVPFDEYDGQFDHPPSVPICDECSEDDDPSPHCSQCPNDPCDCKIADND